MELGNYGIEVWSNYSCLGYALVAAARCGMNAGDIGRLHAAMVDLMCVGGVHYMSVGEAGMYYRGSPWWTALGEGS